MGAGPDVMPGLDEDGSSRPGWPDAGPRAGASEARGFGETRPESAGVGDRSRSPGYGLTRDVRGLVSGPLLSLCLHGGALAWVLFGAGLPGAAGRGPTLEVALVLGTSIPLPEPERSRPAEPAPSPAAPLRSVTIPARPPTAPPAGALRPRGPVPSPSQALPDPAAGATAPVATEPVAAVADGPPSGGGLLSAPPRDNGQKEDALALYAGQVRARILLHTPSGIRGRGTVILAFSLAPDGRLIEAGIRRSSGRETLDHAAREALAAAAPFPSAPAGATAEDLCFLLPVEFH